MMRRVSYRFSALEKRELVKAWVVLSLAFAIVGNAGNLLINLLNLSMVYDFFSSGLTVGVGFLLHEMGHKFVAQKYGLWAEFRAYDQGLMLALVMSFFGFLFAAPGAVMIHGHTSAKRIGKIAAAGPLVNYVLALLFYGIGLVVPIPLVSALCSYGAVVNAFLGLFNMIPAGMFDGKKIINWNKLVYGLMVIGGGVLLIATLPGF